MKKYTKTVHGEFSHTFTFRANNKKEADEIATKLASKKASRIGKIVDTYELFEALLPLEEIDKNTPLR